jgi:hypothetical protein
MTKMIAALCAVIVTLPLLAGVTETITHDVQKDRLVRQGVVRITTKNILSETFTMEINYKIKAKFLFFERNLDGTTSIELPVKYLNPYGYQELEEAGSLIEDEATLVHLGKKNLPGHYDCHKVRITPKKDNKWVGVFTYCQDIPSIGFARTQILMRGIPVVGSHTVYTKLRD